MQLGCLHNFKEGVGVTSRHPQALSPLQYSHGHDVQMLSDENTISCTSMYKEASQTLLAVEH